MHILVSLYFLDLQKYFYMFICVYMDILEDLIKEGSEKSVKTYLLKVRSIVFQIVGDIWKVTVGWLGSACLDPSCSRS